MVSIGGGAPPAVQRADKEPGSTLTDPRVRAVPWRDLVSVSRLEVVRELLLPLPWLAGSLGLAQHGLYVPALGLSFVFFLTGLRVVHNAYHAALGISRRATEWVMFALSLLMLGSMHAVKITHLRHHRQCMSDEDVEAMGARLSGLGALLLGPLFPLRLHRAALSAASPRERRWIYAELLAGAGCVVLALGVLEVTAFRYHVLAMAVGQCLTAFFAVWTVHHGCDRHRFIARTVRGPFKNLVSFNMFFHVEHHLYPRVPTCHLARLAERLDAAVPELQQRRVF